MKNFVILLAGGNGTRMKSDVPKQFLLVNKKPIIAYTLEAFHRNDLIDGIIIVCVKQWIKHLETIVDKYCFKKVCQIVEGGATSHESIRNGVFSLRKKLKDDDFIVVHDAVRPIVPQRIIDDLLSVAHEHGNASSSTECHPPIVLTDDKISGNRDIDREHVMLTAAPQAFNYGLVYHLYEKAEEEHKNNFTYTSSLLIHYGERVYFSLGTTNNILTIPEERFTY